MEKMKDKSLSVQKRINEHLKDAAEVFSLAILGIKSFVFSIQTHNFLEIQPGHVKVVMHWRFTISLLDENGSFSTQNTTRFLAVVSCGRMSLIPSQIVHQSEKQWTGGEKSLARLMDTLKQISVLQTIATSTRPVRTALMEPFACATKTTAATEQHARLTSLLTSALTELILAVSTPNAKTQETVMNANARKVMSTMREKSEVTMKTFSGNLALFWTPAARISRYSMMCQGGFSCIAVLKMESSMDFLDTHVMDEMITKSDINMENGRFGQQLVSLDIKQLLKEIQIFVSLQKHIMGCMNAMIEKSRQRTRLLQQQQLRQGQRLPQPQQHTRRLQQQLLQGQRLPQLQQQLQQILPIQHANLLLQTWVWQMAVGIAGKLVKTTALSIKMHADGSAIMVSWQELERNAWLNRPGIGDFQAKKQSF
jgi:hypothetical protein